MDDELKVYVDADACPVVRIVERLWCCCDGSWKECGLDVEMDRTDIYQMKVATEDMMLC